VRAAGRNANPAVVARAGRYPDFDRLLAIPKANIELPHGAVVHVDQGQREFGFDFFGAAARPRSGPLGSGAHSAEQRLEKVADRSILLAEAALSGAPAAAENV